MAAGRLNRSPASRSLSVRVRKASFAWLRLTDWSGRSELVRRGRCRRGASIAALSPPQEEPYYSEVVLLPAAGASIAAIKPTTA